MSSDLTRRCRAALLFSLVPVLCSPVSTRAAGRPPLVGAPAPQTARPREPLQPRAHGTRVAVDPSRIRIDDGDSLVIRWGDGDAEVVRILGIDTPETRHLEHDIPYAQPFGEEARRFAVQTFADAGRVELLRAAILDPYGRTLAYVFVDGRNYSVLVLRARLALETVSHYGDNGFPGEAAEVLAAAKAAGPVAFEAPYRYRSRMRELSEYMRAQGTYPEE
jgi:micrococcal nuclease